MTQECEGIANNFMFLLNFFGVMTFRVVSLVVLSQRPTGALATELSAVFVMTVYVPCLVTLVQGPMCTLAKVSSTLPLAKICHAE